MAENDQKDQLSARLMNYCVEIVKLTTIMQQTPAERHMGEQLLRASTSAGATYEEARAAESKADLARELRLVLRALRESVFWLKLIQKSGISRDPIVTTLIEHARQMVNAIAKSVATAKSQ